MSMFQFRDRIDQDTEQVERRIRRLLEARQAMPVGELSLRLGLDEDDVRAKLEDMAAKNEIECLRPIAYGRDDHDFYRLCRKNDVRIAYADRQAEEGFVRLAGEAMACV